MEWFRKAAEKGYVGAQFSVVSMNEHGKGVDQNYSIKMELYRKTAEQGHACSQYLSFKRSENHFKNL